MSAIHIFQSGHEIAGKIALGALCLASFDGATASWTWALTLVPAGSGITVDDPAAETATFTPSAYGLYTLQFTDSFANVYTFNLVVYIPATSPIEILDDERGRAFFMADMVGMLAHTTLLGGQNTDGSNVGGALELAGGAGSTTNGVRISERVLGGIWETYQIAQYSAMGGALGSVTYYGGSSSTMQFRFDGSSIQVAQFLGSLFTKFIFDGGQGAATGFLVRTAAGGTIGDTKMLEIEDAKLGFYGITPVTQATRPGQLTDSTGGVVDGTLVNVQTLLVADPAKCNANFADCADRINKIEAALHGLGLLS